MRTFTTICSLTAGLLMLIGCGSVTREVLLRDSMVAHEDAAQPDSAKRLYFGGLADKRTETGVGYELNDRGQRTEEVRSKNDVAKWVNREIVLQLKQKSFAFLAVDAPEDERTVAITGDLLKVTAVMYNDYLAEVQFAVKVTDRDRVVFEKTYTGKARSAKDDETSADRFNKALRSALLAAASELAADVDSCYSALGGGGIPEPGIVAGQPVAASPATDMEKNASGDTSVFKSSAFAKELCPRERNKLAIIQGKRQRYDIKLALDSIRTNMQWYFQKRQKENPSIKGAMCLRIVIAPNGRVSGIEVIGPVEDEQLRREVEKRFGEIRLAKAPNSMPTELVYSLDFGAQQSKYWSRKAIAGRAVFAIISFLLIQLLFH